MAKKKIKIKPEKDGPTFHFKVTNAPFFRNIIASLNVDEINANTTNEKVIENEVIVENFVIFNVCTHGIKVRSISRCKQFHAFFYMDSKCFDDFDFSDKSTLVKTESPTKQNKRSTQTTDDNVIQNKSEFFEKKLIEKQQISSNDPTVWETNSVNSDNLVTSHVFDTENRDIVKLSSASPLKKAITNNDEWNDEIFQLRNQIYRQQDAKNNSYEIVVSINELLRSFEFLQPTTINFEYDKDGNEISVTLTDGEKDTSKSIIKIIFIDEKNLVTRVEQDTFLSETTNFFSIPSEVFSFCLEYLLNCNEAYIVFHLKEHVDETTPILEMITQTMKVERSIKMFPKNMFSSFRSNQNLRFKYRTKHLQKINQALKLSCHLRMDFQENGLARFQITLCEYNSNGTHLCYFVYPAE